MNMIYLKNKQYIIGLITALLMSVVALISSFKSKTEITAYKAALETVNSQIAHQKEQQRVLVTNLQEIYKDTKELTESTASLTKRLEEVQQYQLEQVVRESKSSDEKVTAEDINHLQNQIATVQFQLNSVNQKIVELNKQDMANTVNKQAGSTNKALSVKPIVRTLSPSFAILGIESRGGELFVSVAPSKNAKLNQISLMREGDTYRGWQLSAIKSNAAVFVVNGRQQIINIR